MFRPARGRHSARSAPPHQPKPFRWSIILIEAIVGVAVLLNVVRACNRSRQVNTDISALQTEIQQTNAQAASLEELITYVNSSAYVEEKARRDLGMQQPGEHIVIIDDVMATSSTSTERDAGLSPRQKWVQLFFDR
jgi:cell division protein FtsL